MRGPIKAGVEGRVSGHSLRVGGALQSLAAAGASIVEMQTAGRWQQSPSMPGPLCPGPARHTRRGGQASLWGVEPPMGGRALQQSRIVFPVKDHSADEWPDAFVIDV